MAAPYIRSLSQSKTSTFFHLNNEQIRWVKGSGTNSEKLEICFTIKIRKNETVCTGMNRIDTFISNKVIVSSRVPNNSASRIVNLQIRRDCVEQ